MDTTTPPLDPSSQSVNRRLTLTLPPSRPSSKPTGKSKNRPYGEPPTPKIPRPVKLKPLKEVLSKLITQIKKKDDYAFFLQPVDASQVQGYADVVKNPMDFGTMSAKVDRGRYRSLEEFTADFRLVTSNARKFNPPTTLFHTEAARIEAWGLEQITRASAHVIEYETDWNIDVVADEQPAQNTNDDLDENNVKDAATHINVEHDEGRSIRSPSVVSTAPGQPEKSKRGRVALPKKIPGAVSESIDVDGRLPGSKDGLGAFPPGSDMAELMLALKLKGKRYKTKKERMRIEKEGLPHLADGSLNYYEMEDPFSVLQALTPDPPVQPHLFSLLVPTAAQDTHLDSADLTPQPPTPAEMNHITSLPALIPGPSAVPPNIPSILFPAPDKPAPPTANSTSAAAGRKRLRHWSIIRNPPSRSKYRDGDESYELTSVAGPAKRLRVAEATDYGAFATLAGRLAVERSVEAHDFVPRLGSEAVLFDELRKSIKYMPVENSAAQLLDKVKADPTTEDKSEDIDTTRSAEEYIIDVVYGGLDGLAYVRSIAEFVGGRANTEVKLASSESNLNVGLGTPLAHWVEQQLIDPLTAGNHSVLRQAARLLTSPTASSTTSEVQAYITSAKETKPELWENLQTLHSLSDTDAQIDMVPLLRAPHELFAAENEWAGVAFKAKRDRERELMEHALAKADAAGFLAYAIESHRRSELTPVGSAGGTVGGATNQASASAGDTVEVIEHALVLGADAIVEMDQRLRRLPLGEASGIDPEDPVLRKLRLNLLAVAKRAPLDKIAKLPAELVPPHIRHIVPTLTSK